jgi:P27 family predicted phage terminase small subunit
MPRRSRAELATPQIHLVEPPGAPEHLSPAMKAWWGEVVSEYILQSHHLRLLEAACDAWDIMVQARETLARDGLTVTSETGSKAHPAVIIERDSRIAFARLVRELDLDTAPPPSPDKRPPALYSNRR